ncbi:MAG: dipeptidase [Desulfocapsaceae bacterium]|jgi:membrane dipeptidase|nr:dipeptidase [Desulfocapsaceae bacterium]
MNTELREQIAAIHHKAFTVDAHFDLTYDVANRRERGEKKVIERSYLETFRAGGFDLIVSAIFIHDLFLPEMGLRRALDQISCLHQEIEETPGAFKICRSTREAFQAKDGGETAIFLSLEGADPLQNDIHLLRIFYELGVRGLGLVWSRRNYAGDGAFFESTREGRKGGLTPFGIRLIEEAQRLGIFIDVSHLNDEGFWDVMNTASKPVIASHSNCRSLADSMRNLTDEQIKAVGRNGGVIGMNSVNAFTSKEKRPATAADMAAHVEHIAAVAGISHVGIGFDICNSFTNYLQMKESLPCYDIIKDHSHLFEFTAALIARGFSEDEIIAVLGGNFLRVYAQTIG